jgi:hypothetical protein
MAYDDNRDTGTELTDDDMSPEERDTDHTHRTSDDDFDRE